MEDKIEIKQPEFKDKFGSPIHIGDLVIVARGYEVYKCRVDSLSPSRASVTIIEGSGGSSFSVYNTSLYKIPK